MVPRQHSVPSSLFVGVGLILALSLGMVSPSFAQGKPSKGSAVAEEPAPPPEATPSVMPEPESVIPEPDTSTLTNPGAPVSTMAPALTEQIQSAMTELEAGFDAGEAEGFRDMIAQHPDANGEALFGQLLFMRRHFARSAWFFGADALAHPDRAASLNNFAAMLEETYLDNPSARPVSWLTTAVALQRRASGIAPGDAAVQNNLGHSLTSLWRADPSAVDLDEAVAALRRAQAAGGDDVVILANLAQALDAAGDVEGAADALEASNRQRSYHPSVVIARDRVSEQTSTAYAGRSRDYCSVDFRCDATCPPGIIGRINFVTCEMEQSSAQMACGAGQPYPESFDCGGQIPEFGVMIPGLHSGVGFSTPWGTVAATTDSEGNVNWRIEAGPNFGPVNPYLRADGSYNPNGGWSTTGFRAGVKYNLIHGNPVGATAGNWNFQPAYIQVEGQSNGPTEITSGLYGNATILR